MVRAHRKMAHEKSYPCKYELMKSLLCPQRSSFVSATQGFLRVVWREDRCSQHCSFAQTVESLESNEEASLLRGPQTDLSGLVGSCHSLLSHSWIVCVGLHRPALSNVAEVFGKGLSSVLASSISFIFNLDGSARCPTSCSMLCIVSWFVLKVKIKFFLKLNSWVFIL